VIRYEDVKTAADREAYVKQQKALAAGKEQDARLESQCRELISSYQPRTQFGYEVREAERWQTYWKGQLRLIQAGQMVTVNVGGNSVNLAGFGEFTAWLQSSVDAAWAAYNRKGEQS
jgi:hypothetical protein